MTREPGLPVGDESIPPPAGSPTEPPPAPAEESPSTDLTVHLRFEESGLFDMSASNHVLRVIRELHNVMIPAGGVGSDYEWVYPLDLPASVRLDRADFGGFEELGLTATCDRTCLRIAGSPVARFDSRVRVVVDYRLAAQFEKPFIVNPDPKTLWKEIEPAAEDGYPHPHLASAGRTGPDGKRVIAASRRGRSHAHEGKFREDSFHFDMDEESGWAIFAVADGAGSARYSRKGADIACRESVRLLKENLAKVPAAEMEGHLREWSGAPDSERLSTEKRQKSQIDNVFLNTVYFTWMSIKEEADSRQAALRDYHTTLLLLAVKKFDFGWFIASYWVGDGAVALYGKDGRKNLLVLGKPDDGEFAGQTRFLTMKEQAEPDTIRARLRYAFATDFTGLLLMSDGISDPFFPAEVDLMNLDCWNDFWDRVTATVPLGEQTDPQACADALLEWLNFWSKGDHDDRTLLLYC